MASSGTMNPGGVLHAALSLAATLLKPHVVLMESINSLIKRVVDDSPNISLELLSARVSLKKHMGFASDIQYCDTFITTDTVDEPSADKHSCLRLSGEKPNPWKSMSSNAPKRLQPRLMAAKTFKQIQPFALVLSEKLLPLLPDIDQVVQQLHRWACPSALKKFEPSNNRVLNYADRPFTGLPYRRQRFITQAAVFHRQWFDEHKATRGKLSLLAFCEYKSGAMRVRSKTSLLDGRVERVFMVGEVHGKQAWRVYGLDSRVSMFAAWVQHIC